MREMVATALIGMIGGMLGAVLILKLKSPTPADLAGRIDEIEWRVNAHTGRQEVPLGGGPGWKCRRDTKACYRSGGGGICEPAGCDDALIAYCGGENGGACFATYRDCDLNEGDDFRRKRPNVQICYGVQ